MHSNGLRLIGCDGAENNPVLATLPPALKLSLEPGGAAEWIRSTFHYAAEEIAAGRPGSETVLAKLSERRCQLGSACRSVAAFAA